MEESLERRSVQRRLLADLEAGGLGSLKKQTVEDLFNPQPGDNGIIWNEKTKKKDKVQVVKWIIIHELCHWTKDTGIFWSSSIPRCVNSFDWVRFI